MTASLSTGASVLLAFCGILNASIIFTVGNNPQPNESNIMFDIGPNVGALVAGTFNDGVATRTVDFKSGVSLTVVANSRVGATTGALKNIDIFVPGYTFADLIVNPFIGGGVGTPGVATVTVSSVTAAGIAEANSVFSYNIANGNNFLTITTANGERITNANLGAPNGVSDIRQPRMSGPIVIDSATPEPNTGAMLGCGLLGLTTFFKCWAKRRRTGLRMAAVDSR